VDDSEAEELRPRAGVFRPCVLVISSDVEVRALVEKLDRTEVESEITRSFPELEARAGRDGMRSPDVVFLDLELCEGREDKVVLFVRRSFPLAALVALARGLDGEHAARLLSTGVPSLIKPVSATALSGLAVRLCQSERGSAGTGPASARQGMGRLDALLEAYASERSLSRQQRLILRLHLAGNNDKEIASSCSCSEATVYEHWRRMARKAGGMHKGCVITDFHRFLDR
jgi:DNA-binding NarL/FixJ family response regulator